MYMYLWLKLSRTSTICTSTSTSEISKILQKEVEQHKKLMKGSPFRLGMFPQPCFDLNPFRSDRPLPAGKKEPSPPKDVKPFKQSSPAKRVMHRQLTATILWALWNVFDGFVFLLYVGWRHESRNFRSLPHSLSGPVQDRPQDATCERCQQNRKDLRAKPGPQVRSNFLRDEPEYRQVCIALVRYLFNPYYEPKCRQGRRNDVRYLFNRCYDLLCLFLGLWTSRTTNQYLPSWDSNSIKLELRMFQSNGSTSTSDVQYMACSDSIHVVFAMYLQWMYCLHSFIPQIDRTDVFNFLQKPR